MPAKMLRHLLSRHAPVRLASPLGAGQWVWLWRWWRACRAPVHAANRARLHRLARYSHQRLGAVFRFKRTVVALVAGDKPAVRHAENASSGTAETEAFDAIAVCAAMGSTELLRPLGLRLPLAAVQGYSITAPIRLLESHPHLGPASAVMDEKYKVVISRLGQRLRVAGSAELGGTLCHHSQAAIHTLHKVLDDCYPGCAQHGQVQAWKGARPMLPDGLPVLGAASTAAAANSRR